MKEYIVETKSLKKYYQMGENTVKALDGVDFRVKAREFVAIIGKSGSGKSTLLNCLSTIDCASAGDILFNGVSFDSLKKSRYVDVDNVQMDFEQSFYILCLAPNAARLSVRFFYQNTFGDILKNIKEHYKRLDIVKPLWVEKKYLSVYELLRETVNPNSKDKTPIPNMSAMVLQSILSGNRYPASLYTDTVIRIRSEQGNVTWGRASIIKAYLIKNYSWKEGENYMGLEETCNDTAYILGRLFSVLESIQKEANQGINATIKDRYFNSACATPASVFPILFKLENSHIKKLEREKGSGSKIFYEKIIGNLMKKLVLFPRSLSLEEQGKFMLGYYHQTQKKYEKKEDK